MVVEDFLRFKVYHVLRELEKGPLIMRVLGRRIGANGSNVFRYVEKLEFYGLVETFFEREYPYRKIVKITRKGKRFLEKLREADRVLKRGW